MDSVMTRGFKRALRSLTLGAALLLASGSFLAAQANVTQIGTWTQVNNNTTVNPATGTLNEGASASGLRALVLAVAFDWTTTQSTGATTATASYGGQPMTQAAWKCSNTTGGRCSGIFYILESGIVAAGANTTTSVSITGTGGAGYNFVTYGATFDNVSQSSTIADWSTNSSVAASVTTLNFGKNVATGTGDQLIYIRTVDAASATFTPPANCSHPIAVDSAAAHSSVIGMRTVPASDVSENLSVVSAGNNIATISVAVLNEFRNNTLVDCSGCHDYPPADGSARNTPEGAVTGDHGQHNFACSVCHVAPATTTSADFDHRDGEIKMATPIFGGSGSYSRIAPINQSNNPTTGTCSNVSCHNGAVTPQWGVGTTTCSSCHALPPATDAHTKHYTAKGWSTGVTTNCTVCHPDNTVAHSDVTDGTVAVIGSLTPGGTSPAITCSATPTGCHNGLAAPAWNTTNIACLGCHTVGGASANPTSGLHNMSAGGVQKHDDTLQSGNCVNCHNPIKPASHANGTFAADSATYNDRFIFRSNMTWTDGTGNTGTCSGTGLTGCHQDSGSWSRLWSTAANSTVTTAGDARCAVCHGQFGDWRVGTSHYNTLNGAASTRGSSHNSLTGAANACEDCHSYPTLIANHQNGQVTVNQGSWTVTRATGRTYCSVCHTNDGLPTAAGTHTFTSSALTLQTVAGANDPVGDCSGCHGGGTSGATENSFWPDSGVKNIDNVGSEDDEGAHVKHMTVLARRVYNQTLIQLLDDAASATKQKALCEYCHAANTNDGDHTTGDDADVFDTTLGKKALHLNAAADANATYTTGACTNVDCHNSKSTATSSRNWYSGAASTCTMCHTPGGATNDPNSGLHTGASPTISAQKHDDTLSGGCVICHTALPDVAATQTATHIDGFFTSNGNIAGDKTNMGLFTAYTATADGIGSCSGAAVGGASCHAGVGDAGSWARRWNSAIHYVATGAECAGCHGGFSSDWTFGSVANTSDGSVEHARDWQGADGAEVIGSHSNNTANTNKCNTCHVYGDPQYVMGTHHRNGQITMNSVPTYNGTNWNCTNSCHSDNTGHNLEDSGWTTGSLAGPPMTCTTCHGGGTPAAGVSSASSHTDADGPGTSYTSSDCWACHAPSSGATAAQAHADGTTGVDDVEIPTVYTGTTAVPTMTKADGTTALYSSHTYKIRIGGVATGGKSTEAEICWGCHDAYQTARTTTATTITFTTNTIVDSANGFGTKYAIGSDVTIYGSSVAANNKTATLTGVAAGTLTFAAGTFTADATAGERVTVVDEISEWGINQNANTGNLNYDYGQLYTDITTSPGTMASSSNWVATAYWRSGKGKTNTLTSTPYWYKRGALQSTHAANYQQTFTAAITAGNSLGYNRTESKDAVGNIRCSYCHDVHGTHDTIKGDVAGQPYLRGTWIGNLYQEDGAPRYGMANFTVQGATTSTTQYGIAPRSSSNPANSGLAGADRVGGFWIDQNSNNPTSTITGANNLAKATNSSGLCEQCHGSDKNGTWTAAELGTLDQVTAEGLWVSGYNGHANVVLGGAGGESGTAPAAASAEIRARNILTRTKRGNSAASVNSDANKVNTDMGLINCFPGGNSGYSYRSAYGGSTGYGWIPRTGNTTETGTTTGRPYAYRYFAWNSTDYGTSTRNYTIAAGTLKLVPTNATIVATETAHDAQLNYHTFTCSKCHNPHASRLPKLMITNCLDTNHNTWEDKSTYTGTALTGIYANTRHSQWASATNCHRLDARAVLSTGQVTTLGPGWNKATPWMEDSTPNGTKTADLP